MSIEERQMDIIKKLICLKRGDIVNNRYLIINDKPLIIFDMYKPYQLPKIYFDIFRWIFSDMIAYIKKGIYVNVRNSKDIINIDYIEKGGDL